MVSSKKACDLCGLPIDGRPVKGSWGGEEEFCCEGCARVYELARAEQMLDQVLPAGPATATPAVPLTLARPKSETAPLVVEGMWCAGCAVAAERLLRREPGVREADVSFAAQRGRLVYDPQLVNPDKLLARLAPLGYRARILDQPQDRRRRRVMDRVILQLLVAFAFGMQVMLLYLVQLYPLYALGQHGSTDVLRLQYVAWALATPVLFVGGFTFLVGAWRAIQARTASMDTLVALGILAAYGYSVYATLAGTGEVYFDSVVMITVFVLFGRVLETMGGTQARKDLFGLYQLQPERAWRHAAGGWQQVDSAAVAPGETILVKPGERVPLDAQVIEGEGTLDESLLSGESLPVAKGPGDTLYAGSLLQEGALVARVLRPAANTRLSQIADLVSETLSAKPPVQRLADRASSVLAVGIVLLALLTFALRLWSGRPLAAAILNGVAVLVVACPCALGLATPLALSVTLGKATRRGLLVRNPAILEMAPQIQHLVLDKTGTLTRGRPSVTAVATAPGSHLDLDDVRQLAASVEQFSEHPLARAIVEGAGLPLLPARDFVALRGLGASARVLGPYQARVLVGSERMVALDAGGPDALAAQARERAANGETVVWVAVDGHVVGLIALRDEPNPSAAQALGALRALGLAVTVLSGDTPATTAAISRELGIESYQGGRTPEDKARQIAAWQQAGQRVGMVGDGVNDAPALAQADLSITVAGGSDIAGQASDLVLTRPDLGLIPWFVGFSRRMRRTIAQNLGWAFAYNLVALPLAVSGLISPILAASAMAASSLLVVTNSLRLRKE